MKKFLSLVLALVMTMSLVTVSAGAKDFTDDADITYDEAVAVISALGVVEGYKGGDFKPTNNLTRQAAAKIICNLILGPTTAAELHADTAPFPDVPVSNEFSGYIAYCAKEGIIGGYSDGYFRGGNPLTGYAFMKMLLGALGYDAAVEGYGVAGQVEPNWSINVAKQAIGIGLNAGLVEEFNGVDQVNREEACLYAFNTLKATMVEYPENSVINVGGAQVTLASARKDVSWGTGTKNDGNIDKDGFVQFAEKYFTKLIRDDGTDDFGRPTNDWTYNKKDIGSYLNRELLVSEYTVEVEGGDVYSDIGSVAADYDLTYVQDGVYMTKAEAKAEAQKIAKKNDDTMGLTGNGVLTQIFVDNDTEDTTIVEINTYLAETDDYNAKKETLKLDIYGLEHTNTVKDVELDDIASIVDYEDGDMVLVTVAKDEVQSIVPVEAIAGVEIEEFDKHDYVISDGEQYDYARTGEQSYSLGVVGNTAVLGDYDKNNLDEVTFDLYLDSYGYLIGIEQVEEDVEYVFIAGYDRPESHLTNKTAEANAIFSDGTQAVIEVNVTKSTFKADAPNAQTFNDWAKENGDETENTWYSYTEKNGVYTLTYVTNQFVNNASSRPAVTEIDSKHISQYNGTHYYYGNADTNYIVVGVDEVNDLAVIDEVEAVTTGVKNVSIDVWTAAEVIKEAGTQAADSQGVYTVHEKAGAYIIASIVIGDDGSVTDKFAYMYGEPKNEKYVKADDAYYWTKTAVIGGVDTTITFKSELPYDDAFAEGLYKVSYDKDGYAVDATPAVHSADYDWVDEFDPDDTTLIKTSFGVNTNQGVVDLTVEGDTLWIENQAIERGFALADECPAVIIEQVKDKTGKLVADKVVEYTTVAKAIKALENAGNAKNFGGDIIMTVKDGLVTSVVLTDEVTKTTNTNTNVNTNLTVGYVGVDTVLNVITLDQDDISAASVDTVTAAALAALDSVGYKASAAVDTTAQPNWTIKAVNMDSANTTEFTFQIVWG